MTVDSRWPSGDPRRPAFARLRANARVRFMSPAMHRPFFEAGRPPTYPAGTEFAIVRVESDGLLLRTRPRKNGKYPDGAKSPVYEAFCRFDLAEPCSPTMASKGARIVTGRVLNAKGLPATGALVDLFCCDYLGALAATCATASVDEAGHFEERLEDSAFGLLVAVALHEGVAGERSCDLGALASGALDLGDIVIGKMSARVSGARNHACPACRAPLAERGERVGGLDSRVCAACRALIGIRRGVVEIDGAVSIRTLGLLRAALEEQTMRPTLAALAADPKVPPACWKFSDVKKLVSAYFGVPEDRDAHCSWVRLLEDAELVIEPTSDSAVGHPVEDEEFVIEGMGDSFVARLAPCSPGHSPTYLAGSALELRSAGRELLIHPHFDPVARRFPADANGPIDSILCPQEMVEPWQDEAGDLPTVFARVVDSAGKPQAGVLVDMVDVGEDGSVFARPTRTTDADGRVREVWPESPGRRLFLFARDRWGRLQAESEVPRDRRTNPPPLILGADFAEPEIPFFGTGALNPAEDLAARILSSCESVVPLACTQLPEADIDIDNFSFRSNADDISPLPEKSLREEKRIAELLRDPAIRGQLLAIDDPDSLLANAIQFRLGRS